MKNGMVAALAFAGAMVAGCVVCSAGTALLGAADRPGSPEPTVAQTSADGAEPASVSPSSTPHRARAASVPKAFARGEWLVGTDVAPGRYESDGPDGDFMCYWQIATAPGAQPGSPGFVTNDVPSGHVYVNLKKGQYFSSSHCQTWTPVI